MRRLLEPKVFWRASTILVVGAVVVGFVANAPSVYDEDGWGGVLILAFLVTPLVGVIAAFTLVVLKRLGLDRVPQRLYEAVEARSTNK